jgi:hypothetical protein
VPISDEEVDPCEHPLVAHEIPIALSIAHLSNKYQLDAQFDDAKTILRKYYPASIEEWDSDDFENIRHRADENAVEVVKFAYEHGIQALLISSCYIILCKYTLDEVMDLDIPRPLLKILVSGWQRILEKTSQITFSWVGGHEPELRKSKCTLPIVCRCILEAIRSGYLTFEKETYSPAVLLVHFNDLSWDTPDDMEFFCSECTRRISAYHEMRRRLAFYRLSEAFGFDDWASEDF